MSNLDIDHLKYRLIHADILNDGRITEPWLCASDDFRQLGESNVTLETYYQHERMPQESALVFCVRNGCGQYIRKMLITDCLVLNRDRHGANIELLSNRRHKTIRFASLFDHGLSHIYCCLTEEELMQFDVLMEHRVQCFVGRSSTRIIRS